MSESNKPSYEDLEKQITEHKRVEEKLSLFSSVVEQVVDSLIITDKEYRITYVNKAFRSLYGYEREELLGKSPAILNADQNSREIQEEIYHTVSAGKPWMGEVANRRKDGSIFPCELIVFPVNDKTGKIISYAGTQRDITSRKQAGERLKSLSKELQAILDASPAYIWFKDTEGRILKVNKSAANSLGLAVEDIEGKLLEEIVTSENAQKSKEQDLEIIRSRKPQLGILQKRELPSGGTSLHRVDKVPCLDEQGNVTGLVVHALDITRQHEMEGKLLQSEKMQVIGQLAGGVAHDFNNQLSVIMGYADLLKMELKDDTSIELAENILTACKRSKDLTTQMLAFARKGKYEISMVNIHEVISEVVKWLERSIDKRIKIKQRLEASLPTIKGDETQLQNALLNIAINARDAMPNGGDLIFRTSVMNLDTEACFALPFDLSPGKYLCTSISDQGIGMDMETVKHAFEPFFTTKKPGQGTGMGLAAVYGTMEHHDGSIRIGSEPGKGTTVYLYLPLARQFRDTQKKEDSMTKSTTNVTGHILVIDDEEIVLNMCAKMLQRIGYGVTTANSAREALEHYRKYWKSIRLVLLDMIMPEISGRELYASLQEINPQIKAILLSGYSIDGPAQEILDLGVQSFLQKPFTIKQLSEKVAEVMSL